MKRKTKEILLTLALFGILTYLGRHAYLLEWLARRYFCLIWVPILVLWAVGKDTIARWITAGAFLGLFLGQVAEDVKFMTMGSKNPIANSSYWGVGVWVLTVALCAGAGCLHAWAAEKWIRHKEEKKRRQEEAAEEKTHRQEEPEKEPEISPELPPEAPNPPDNSPRQGSATPEIPDQPEEKHQMPLL